MTDNELGMTILPHLAQQVPPRFVSHGFSLSCIGGGMGMGQDFSPAPWGRMGMGLDFLDPPRPAPSLPVPVPSCVAKDYNCNFFIP